MSVNDGQNVSAAVTNPAFLKPDVDDYTLSRLGMHRSGSGYFIADIQKFINNVGVVIGLNSSGNYTAEADTTGNTYGSSSTIVSDGVAFKNALIAIMNAFAASGGHAHTGSGADGTKIDLTAGVTNTLPIANGGTNATTATAAINNLLPSQGSAANQYIMSNGTTISWANAVNAVATVGSTPAAAGASISGDTLTLQPADATHAGVVSTTSQTFGGDKTFANNVIAQGKISKAISTDATTGSTIDLATPTTGIVELTGTSTFIRSIPAPSTCVSVLFINKSGQSTTLSCEDGTATANTRIAQTTAKLIRNFDSFLAVYDTINSRWICSVISPALSTFNNVGSSPQAAAVTIDNSGGITLQPADGTHPGLISTTTQTIAGAKTFSGNAEFDLAVAGAITVDSSWTGTGTTYTTPLTLITKFTNASGVGFGGITAPTNSQIIIFTNETGLSCQILNDNASFTAANRIITGTGGNLNIQNHQSAWFYYDTNSSRWRLFSLSGGGATSPLTTKGDIWGYSSVDARVPIGTDGQILMADSTQTLGLKWATGAGGYTATTIQKFTSGSGTYTTPANVAWIRVRMVGGGGGGGGSGTGGAAGGNGTSTTFGTSLLVAGYGNGGGGTNTGIGGSSGVASSLGSGPIGIAISGGCGGSVGAQSTQAGGGIGGSTAFAGGGRGGVNSSGVDASTNSGAGGGGGSSSSIAGGGGGGAGGGFVDAIISAPSATYAYTVGAAGSAGAAGTSGNGGGLGGAGIIEVTEFYNNGPAGTATNITAASNSTLTSLDASAGVAVHGTNTNGNASAGYVGEYVESKVTTLTSMTATSGAHYQDITSITLSAGDWDIVAMSELQSQSAVGITSAVTGIGTVTGDDGTNLVLADTMSEVDFATGLPSGNDWSLPMVQWRTSISGSTTYYLKIRATYPSTAPKYRGKIFARRMR